MGGPADAGGNFATCVADRRAASAEFRKRMPTACPNTTTPPKAIMGIEDNKRSCARSVRR
jgi:hypothetical protein